DQVVPSGRLDGLSQSFIGTPVRMVRTVQQVEKPIDRLDSRIVFVLTNRCDDLPLARRDLCLWKGGRLDDVGDQGEHRLEILCQAGTYQRTEVPGNDNVE